MGSDDRRQQSVAETDSSIALDSTYSKSVSADAATTEDKTKSIWRMILENLLHYIVLIAVILVLCRVIFTIYYIPSASMEPTLNDPCICLGWRLPYVFGDPIPQRGDIMVFRSGNTKAPFYVKRVIGLPGDVVKIRDGDVYVNGELLDEPYLMEQHCTKTRGLYTFKVPENGVFMMGDNREHSNDNRFSNPPYVDIKDLTAKIIWN